MILLEEKLEKDDVEEILSDSGVDIRKVIDIIFIVPIAKRMGHMR